ncbi:MarR family winged helix-turn-helix transcriptional regulator [Paenibacillus sp. BAC0078]
MYKKWNNEISKHNPTELSFNHHQILKILQDRGPQQPSALSEELQITTGGITGLTSKLVKEGYANRVFNEKDRRTVILEITDLGRETLNLALQYRDKMTENFLAEVPTSDIHELRRILEVILSK